MVTFKTAFKNFFKKAFNFKSTATRAEYWWMMLVILMAYVGWILVGLVAYTILSQMQGMPVTDFNAFFAKGDNALLVIGWIAMVTLVSIIFFIPYLALQVRRFRDTGLAEPLVWATLILSILSNFIGGNTLTEIFSNILTILIFLLCVFPTNFFMANNILGRKIK